MSPLDTALEALHSKSQTLKNGLSNHAPMVAEALHHLDRDDAIIPWVERELPRCLPLASPSEAINAYNWHAELGSGHRFADWVAFFAQELSEHDWPFVIAKWVPRLTEGFATAAAHGVLRTAHAVRGLEYCPEDKRPLSIRTMELAFGLASWCNDYLTLPFNDAEVQAQGSRRPPSGILTQAQLVPPQLHSPQGSITAALVNLKDHPTFADQFTALGVEDDMQELAMDIAATFARLFCQSAHNHLHAIVFTHAITGTQAALILLKYLTAQEQRNLVRHAFHTGCALHAVYSEHEYAPPVEEAMPYEAQECIYDAVAHGDDHVIKLTEACVSLGQATGDAFFLKAAEQARRCIPPKT